MKDFEPLIGTGTARRAPDGAPAKISVETTIQRLGEFIVFRSLGEPRTCPTISRSSAAPRRRAAADALLRRSWGQAPVPDDARWLHLDDLAGAGEDWNGPTALVSISVSSARSRRRQVDRGPVGARHGGRRRRVGARLPAQLRPGVAPSRGADLGVPASGVDRPARDDASTLCHKEVVDEVDHRADVVGHDPDDRADRRSRRSGAGRPDGPVMIVEAMDHRLRVSDDRPVTRDDR